MPSPIRPNLVRPNLVRPNLVRPNLVRLTPVRLFVAAVLTLAGAATLAGCGREPSASGGDAAVPKIALASLPPPYDGADLANGRTQFNACRSCHTVAEGGPNLVGPNLHGLFGRAAASKPGYAYSEAMRGAGYAWDAARLDAYLASPRTYVPGTKMVFAGVKAEADRRDLIAYLMVETGYAP